MVNFAYVCTHAFVLGWLRATSVVELWSAIDVSGTGTVIGGSGGCLYTFTAATMYNCEGKLLIRRTQQRVCRHNACVFIREVRRAHAHINVWHQQGGHWDILFCSCWSYYYRMSYHMSWDLHNQFGLFVGYLYFCQCNLDLDLHELSARCWCYKIC